MNLAIDIGNTNTKLALFSTEGIAEQHTLQGFSAQHIFDFARGKNIRAAIVSSVIALPEGFEAELSGYTGTAIILSAATALPFENGYASPETLGKDRLAAAAGACMAFPGKDVLVIDAGTCIKYDFVSSGGRYLGGGISPGLRMRLSALHTFTDKLPLLDLEPAPALIGRDTRESILSGTVNGCIAEIDGIIEEYKKTCPALSVVLSGGDANFLQGKLKNSIFVLPNIVLLGLNEILHCNVPQK